MNTVTFDEEHVSFTPRAQGMAGWLMRSGFATSSTHATRILMLFSILFILVSIFIMMRVNASESFDPGRHFIPVYGN